MRPTKADPLYRLRSRFIRQMRQVRILIEDGHANRDAILLRSARKMLVKLERAQSEDLAKRRAP